MNLWDNVLPIVQCHHIFLPDLILQLLVFCLRLMCYGNLCCAAAAEKYRPTGNVHVQQSGFLKLSLGLSCMFPSSSQLFFLHNDWCICVLLYFINEDIYINREDATTHPCAFSVLIENKTSMWNQIRPLWLLGCKNIKYMFLFLFCFVFAVFFFFSPTMLGGPKLSWREKKDVLSLTRKVVGTACPPPGVYTS